MGDVNREGGTETANRRWLQCFVRQGVFTFEIRELPTDKNNDRSSVKG